MSTEKIACHCCDLVQEVHELPSGSKASCSRCGHVLTQKTFNVIDRATAFAFTSLLFLLVSLPFPFLSFQSQGREQQVTLLQSGIDLFLQGFPFLAGLLSLFILLIPAAILSCYLLILLPLKHGYAHRWMYHLARVLFQLHPWGMAEVFLIGVLVSLVKISSMADLVIGMAFWAYILFAVFLMMTITTVDRWQLWHQLDLASGTSRQAPDSAQGSALSQGLQSCHQCSLLYSLEEKHCHRCESPLHARIPHSLQRTWAYLITALILYLPANIYPIMNTRLLGNDDPSTILGGIVILWQHGSYPIALVVFVASILVPIAKMLALIWLAYSTQAGHQHRIEERIWMYRMTELIGRWSMIDVFVVAVLVAMVQLGGLVSIQPGLAATAFAAVVIFTMLSAISFDPRLIWDTLSSEEVSAINAGREPLNDLLDETK